MLFTSVDRETRFKTKPVVDVVVYRGGDAWWGGVFAFLSEGIGLGFAAMSLVGAGFAAAWAACAVYLGRVFQRREKSAEAVRGEHNGDRPATVAAPIEQPSR
jgi:AAA family ATP:ADP antiporter